MSHITIIVKRVASSPNGVTSEVEYTPEHDASPEDIGKNVGRLVKKMSKLEQPDTE